MPAVRRGFLSCGLAILLSLLGIGAAGAQTFPTKAVRIVTGSPVGGGADFVVRMVAHELAELWGQPVTVQDQVGAFQSIATGIVAKAPADGYTLLFLTNSVLGMGLRPDLPVDLQRDVTPVALVANGPILLVVNPNLPASNIRELIALAKSKPGKLNYGSAGIGTSTHLTGELFNKMADVQIQHVPFDGGVKAAVSAAGGEIDIAWPNIAAVKGMLAAGKLRALGITSKTRSPALPDVPTIDEAGLPGYEYSSWFAMFAPAGVPKDLIARLHAAVEKVTATPQMKQKLEEQGFDPASVTPEEFARKVDSDLKQFVTFAKSIGLDAQSLK